MPTPVFSHPRTVLFQEIDAAGIVFFARIFEWFHDAYAAMLKTRGVSFHGLLSEADFGIPLAHAEADYKAPLTLDTDVLVEIDSVESGETSMTVTYVVRGKDATLHATGKTVHVFIDRKTFRPRRVPDEIRNALGK